MADDAGWQWRIPVQHRTGNGIVYCSRYLDKDAALDRMLGNIEGEPLTEPNVLRFTAGTRRHQWYRNCVAVGLSAGFMEPLESTAIHLNQRSVLSFIRMLPAGRVCDRVFAAYNHAQMNDMAQICAFLVLHYKVCNLRDSHF